MKLYYTPNLNPRVAVAVAKHLQAPVEFVFAYERSRDEDHAFFGAHNPNERFPILIEDDGRAVWETDAIAFRLSEIVGSDFWRRDHAEIEMIKWTSWSAYHFTRHADRAYFERVIVPKFDDPWPPDETAIAADMDEFRRFAGVLDTVLKGREWLVENRLSYADFRVATPLAFAQQAQLAIAGFPEIERWYGQLMQIEAWRDPFKGLKA